MAVRKKAATQAKKTSLSPIICRGCGTHFIPEDRRYHYHSSACREEFYGRTYFANDEVHKICPNCGIDFPTTKPGRQIYCRPECRVDAQIKKRAAVVASVTAERKTFLGERYATMARDGFRCMFCGRSGRDGANLDVEDDGKGGFQTVCNLCVEGREFNKEAVK